MQFIIIKNYLKNNIEDEGYKYKLSKYGKLTEWLEELITRIKTI